MTKIMTLLTAAAFVGSLAAGGAAQAGCLGGAVVGGVAGHYAGRHAGVGAVGGCLVGHHLAVQKKRERRAVGAARRDARYNR